MAINKLIQKELEKVKIAKIGPYDQFKHSFHIEKFKEKTFELNHEYLIKLDNSLLNATSNDLLVNNWNNGKYPLFPYMKAVPVKKIGKMLYFYGVYYNIDTKQETQEEWVGWLPIENIEQIEV